MTDDHLGVLVLTAMAVLFLISCLAMVLTDAPPIHRVDPYDPSNAVPYVNKEHTP